MFPHALTVIRTSPLKSCIPHVHLTRCACTAYHYKPIQTELVPTEHCTGVTGLNWYMCSAALLTRVTSNSHT